MFTTERQNMIMEILKKKKAAFVSDLAQELYVSDATVRRDLKDLQKLGLVERSHGGAILPENADEISIFVRISKNAKEKEQAATTALKIIPEFKTAFIDSSSTALALAGRMDLSYKTIITNNLQTAMQLSKKPNVNLILLGGNVQFNTNSSAGSWTTRQLNEFAFDLMLCSCAAISSSGVYERSIEQKEIKLAAFMRSKTKILIVDHSKFSDFASYRLASTTDYDYIVSNTKPPENLLKLGTFIY